MSVVTEVEFRTIAQLVRERFDVMSKHQLFVADVVGDEIYAQYLASFPEGSNPMFRERTEHDCSTCRHFIKNIGGVVLVHDGQIETIWGAELPGHYEAVAAAMDEFIRSKPIFSVFAPAFGYFGQERNQETDENGKTHTWHHLHCEVPRSSVTQSPGEEQGKWRDVFGVFKRGLSELTPAAIADVLDLIQSNSLYRGAEHEAAVKAFQQLQKGYLSTVPALRDNYVWSQVKNPASRFRNTVIGTLVQDLSEGKTVESAVGSFESKVAPANYKRPKSLITPKMVEDAVAKVSELGLEDALHRRFAKLSDVSVNNVLFVDNSVRGQMRDGIAGLLQDQTVKAKPKVDRATPIMMGDFVNNVLPKAKEILLLTESSMVGNFVSLTAPVHQTGKHGKLFRWNNDFAWSYDGNVTDTIKQRVKAAGGNVTARCRVSLSWYNFDDLDLHMAEPTGNHIYYGSRQGISGRLDVDMNAGGPRTREPVENIFMKDSIAPGTYSVRVKQFYKRESVDVGFVMEFEIDGSVHTFRYDAPVTDIVPVFTFTVENNQVTSIKAQPQIQQGVRDFTKWGIKTGELVKVNTLLLSPNYWDDNSVGNKHWFFVLSGCANPDPARGFYNEFLSPALEPHRKVFEVLADKMKCEVTAEQLSGLGFSSTRKDEATLVVRDASSSRAYRVTF